MSIVSRSPLSHTGVIPRYRSAASAGYYMRVNCAPAKCCVWPVIAPAQAWVRAGAVLRGFAFLSPRFAIGSWLALRFLSRRFASAHGWPCGSVAAFCLGSRLSFSSLRKKKRPAICCVPIPAWVGIAIRAFSSVVRLSGGVSSLWACAFLYGDPDGVRRNAGNGRRGNAENGVGGAA